MPCTSTEQQHTHKLWPLQLLQGIRSPQSGLTLNLSELTSYTTLPCQISKRGAVMNSILALIITACLTVANDSEQGPKWLKTRKKEKEGNIAVSSKVCCSLLLKAHWLHRTAPLL